MSIKFEIHGLDKFMRQLSKKGIAARIATDLILKDASFRVEAGAKNRAAVDTGYMKRTIFQAKIGELTYKVVAPVHYAIYVEKGTRKMRAQPFLKPALNEERIRLFSQLKQIYGK